MLKLHLARAGPRARSAPPAPGLASEAPFDRPSDFGPRVASCGRSIDRQRLSSNPSHSYCDRLLLSQSNSGRSTTHCGRRSPRRIPAQTTMACLGGVGTSSSSTAWPGSPPTHGLLLFFSSSCLLGRPFHCSPLRSFVDRDRERQAMVRT